MFNTAKTTPFSFHDSVIPYMWGSLKCFESTYVLDKNIADDNVLYRIKLQGKILPLRLKLIKISGLMFFRNLL